MHGHGCRPFSSSPSTGFIFPISNFGSATQRDGAGIHSIPASILIDQSGKNIAADLRGDNLSATLEGVKGSDAAKDASTNLKFEVQ